MGNRILVPHDGSELADAALRFALDRCSDSEVVVLHVVEPFADHTEAGAAARPGNWRERAETYAEEILDDAREIADDRDVEIDTDWQYGRPRNVIVEYARDVDADQIVMGSHGRSGIEQLFLGSVAETTVRRSPVPVTVVRGWYVDDDTE